jgi:N-glycosylase/DNA lyase
MQGPNDRLIKVQRELELIQPAPPQPKYWVFEIANFRGVVAYHISGSLWQVVGDAATVALAQDLARSLNRAEGYQIHSTTTNVQRRSAFTQSSESD